MIEEMDTCCRKLIATLENNDENVEECVNNLVTSVENAWKAYCNGNIEVTIPNMPRPMYLFITQELPTMINDQTKKERIIRELKLFLNTMNIVLEPKVLVKGDSCEDFGQE